MSNSVDLVTFSVMAVVFIALTLALGWYGYKNTKNNDEYLLGRNKTNPVIIALSYGATFLSASAVINKAQLVCGFPFYISKAVNGSLNFGIHLMGGLNCNGLSGEVRIFVYKILFLFAGEQCNGNGRQEE